MKLLTWGGISLFIEEFVVVVEYAKVVEKVIEIAANDPVNKSNTKQIEKSMK